MVNPPSEGGTSNAVTLKATGPLLTMTVGTITRTTILSVPVTITNTGNINAAAMTVTNAKLGTAATTTTVPIALGTIAVNGHVAATFPFPTTAGASGKTENLVVKGTYTGGTFTSTLAEKLP